MADFTLISKMSRVCKDDWLVGFSFYMFVEHKRAVGVDFKWPLDQTLFLRDF